MIHIKDGEDMANAVELSDSEKLMKEFLTPETTFSSKWLDRLQSSLDTHMPSLADYAIDIAKPPSVERRNEISFKRSGLDGHICALEEKLLPPRNDWGELSINRNIGTKKHQVRGRSGKMPFTPGGLDITSTSSQQKLHRSDTGLLDIAPGLSRSMEPSIERQTAIRELVSRLNLGKASNIEVAEESDDEELSSEEESESQSNDLELPINFDDKSHNSDFTAIDYLLPDSISFVRQLPNQPAAALERKWAHMVDVNQHFENFEELVPNPARKWPFELDNFQKEAIFHLEQGDSVLVAAHTSAGKTVVAEYAMSMAVKHMTKCIYTSPIKALSNQKYRDFSKEYDDVGILTGDVQLNPEATTLIMTTEILRSMLYRGADIIRDVEFIIFDEVHYVNDSDRGVVWEEVIIMLPEHVKLILLSATVPNTFEFANWVGRTKQKNVYVIATPKRPVPLTHNLWVKKKLFEIVNSNSQFSESGYKKCADYINPPPDPASKTNDKMAKARGGGGPSRGGGTDARSKRPTTNTAQRAMRSQMAPKGKRFNSGSRSKQDFLDIFAYLKKSSLLPAVVFVFSRNMCEQHASSVQSLDLNSGREKAEVFMFIDKAVSRLRKEDRELPQIQMLRDFLTRGIGVHHSGILPIMKEVVEILFARGLVKILFATETFAMGLNLPTRTVVFSAVRKFDSKTMRTLNPGEYTQMAGRAGRRGLDKVGTVIIMTGDDLDSSASLKTMILGKAVKLTSQFRLTYTMILSLLRIEAVKVEDVIKQSFSENATFVLGPEREKKLLQLKSQLQAAEEASLQRFKTRDDLGLMVQFWRDCRKLDLLRTQIYEVAFVALNMIHNLCIFHTMDNRYAAGMIMDRCRNPVSIQCVTFPGFAKTEGESKNGPNCHIPFGIFSKSFKEVRARSQIVMQVPISNIDFVSKVRVPSKSLSLTASRTVYETALKDETIWEEVNLKRLRNVEVIDAIKERRKIVDRIRSFDIDKFGGVKGLYGNLFRTASEIGDLEDNIAKVQTAVTSQNTELIPDYQQRLAVLKDANYVDDNLNVMLKGRVACEISTGYELYVTELILDNFFSDYEPEEIVALLSAFVFEGARNVSDAESVTPRLDEGRHRVLEIVAYVQELAEQRQVILSVDESEFADKGRFGLMQVVYEWARGLSFNEITLLTTIHEGTIVRVINRLDEVCRAVMSAARIIGDVTLYDKVAIGQERIKRDIVFCSSLYL